MTFISFCIGHSGALNVYKIAGNFSYSDMNNAVVECYRSVKRFLSGGGSG